MRRTLLGTTTALTAVLALAGCSTHDGPTPAAAGPTSTVAADPPVTSTPEQTPTPEPEPTSAALEMTLEVPADEDWADDYDDDDADGGCVTAARFAHDIKDRSVVTLLGADGKAVGKVKASLSDDVDTDADDNDLCVYDVSGLDVPFDRAPYRLRIGAFTSDTFVAGNLSSLLVFDDSIRSSTDKAFLKYLKRHQDADDYDTSEALSGGPEACAELEAGYKPGSLDAVNYLVSDATDPLEVAAVKYYCPKFSDTLSLAARTFDDGDYLVGSDIKAGTYRTAKRATDCYWERSTSGGSIIANDFVSFAAQGVTVTIYKGQGFTSDNCGYWYPVN